MLERLYEAARSILPEVMEEEIGSILEPDLLFPEALRRIEEKGNRWERLREILQEVERANTGN